jgi:predicted DNA-binding protein
MLKCNLKENWSWYIDQREDIYVAIDALEKERLSEPEILPEALLW